VVWPEPPVVQAIEDALLVRAEYVDMAWTPDQTVADLVAENVAEGVVVNG